MLMGRSVIVSGVGMDRCAEVATGAGAADCNRLTRRAVLLKHGAGLPEEAELLHSKRHPTWSIS
jgi:hypothetical protein